MSLRIEINILGKMLQVEAPHEAGVQHLQTAARALDAKMQQIRTHNQTMPTERIAIMAALNIMHDLLTLQNEQENTERELQASLRRMQDLVEA